MTGAGSRRPRAAVFAFACDPERGSEPGAAWGVVRALAECVDCTVLVGPEHADALDRWRAANPGDGSRRFVVVPDGGGTDYEARGRIAWFAAYLRWLPAARRAARRLHADAAFDLACHASYAAYWLPSPAESLGIPLVWGPVGGAVTTPLALWPSLGARGALAEVVDFLAVRAAAALPPTRATWRAATVAVVQNEATRRRLPAVNRERAVVLNHALFTAVPGAPPAPRERRDALLVGALESRKGPSLVVRAMAHVPDDVRLVVAGSGPERAALERLAARLRVASRIDFLGPVARERVVELIDGAAAVVFAGLREEGGIALAEAMLRGAPVVVLANGGALAIAESAVDGSRVALVAPGRPGATARGIARAITRFAREPHPRSTPNLDYAAARGRLHDAVREALAHGASCEAAR